MTAQLMVSDSDMTPLVLESVLYSLEDGDVELKAIGIRFLPELLGPCAPFARANFEQLFVAVCQIARAIRDARDTRDAAPFDEAVVSIFFEAWDTFLTSLRILASDRPLTFLSDAPFRELCECVPPSRDLLDTEVSDDPVADWRQVLYCGFDADEQPYGEDLDPEECLRRIAVACVQNSDSPRVPCPVSPIADCEKNDMEIVNDIVSRLKEARRRDLEINEDELPLYVWLDLRHTLQQDALNPDRDQLIAQRAGVWLNWAEHGGDRPIGRLTFLPQD
jgi:hypothetical protein